MRYGYIRSHQAIIYHQQIEPLPKTQFYTLNDVLKNLELRLWKNHTVSRQKQEPAVGQSIETSLQGSLASNLLGCSCEGIHSTTAPVLNNVSSLHLEEHKGAFTQLRGLTLSIFCPCICLPIKCKLTRFLCYFVLLPCFCPAAPDELSHICAKMHFQQLRRA